MTEPLPEDTIVALASGRGEAGVAVIRVSGPASMKIRQQIFLPIRDKMASPWHLIYGSIRDDQALVIDDCLVVSMPGPNSFTGEDVMEIQCHGSSAVIRRIIDLVISAGARAAEPGEFSRRAFLNGKMDLAQAEALSDLIAARSESARRLSLRQLRGGLSSKLRQIYSELIDAAAQIEAHLDFPEEDIPAIARDTIVDHMDRATDEMQRLLRGHEKARVQVEGARVILAGEPNAGKSSLFNALVGRERAIVSPHPGTTRDTIEATLEIDGLAITLVDTAGIRPDAGEVEQIGINRTFDEIQGSDLVLHLSDSEAAFSSSPITGIADDKIIRVLTKQDGGFETASRQSNCLPISSAKGLGIAKLETLIQKRLLGDHSSDEDVEMSRVRHAQALSFALQSVERAKACFMAGESGDLVMVDLRDGLSYIGEILGERLDEQILDRIFSTFCLGK